MLGKKRATSDKIIDVAPVRNGDIDTGIICLVNVLQVLGLPADGAQLRHQFAEPGKNISADAMVRAIKRLGLKGRSSLVKPATLPSLPRPAIVELKSGEFMVFGGIKDGNVLVLDARTNQITSRDLDSFVQDWTGRVIQVTKRATLGGQGSSFDVSWFVPAIWKYRRLFSEVLIASFFLQIAALVTPLFFQVVIDKVLVHRGLTTLDVLVFALIVVSVFEVLLGGLRTYIFSHTTNRIDVELGAKLYRHLLALPLAYFEARQVGQSVARVRELENIRDFITGSTLTLLIDTVFTTVFFVVMWYFSPLLTMIVLGSIRST